MPKMGLVLQGGGALGAYEYGAVTRLVERGWQPVAVATTRTTPTAGRESWHDRKLLARARSPAALRGTRLARLCLMSGA
jgi:hypothetical protein